MAKYIEHSFYCMRCGKKVYNLQRRDSHKHEKHHRKKLWCPWCCMEVNTIECRNDEEVYEFREAFEKGAYKEELAESLAFIKNETNILWS